MSLETIVKKHVTYQQNFDKKMTSLKNRIEALEYKKQEMDKKYKYWGKTLIKPLAKELQTYFPEYKHIELLGPFGLRCSLSVWLYKETKNKLMSKFGREEGHNKFFKKDNIISITFIPRGHKDGAFEYETGETTKECRTGTIGDMNGFNNVTKQVESIEELVNHLKKQIPPLS